MAAPFTVEQVDRSRVSRRRAIFFTSVFLLTSLATWFMADLQPLQALRQEILLYSLVILRYQVCRAIWKPLVNLNLVIKLTLPLPVMARIWYYP